MKQKRRTMKWKIILISLIVFVASLIFSIIVRFPARASPDYNIDYLSATSLTGFGTDYRQLVTTTGTADTTTSVKHDKTAAPVYFFYDPFTTGSTATGTPSATVLKGYGWRSNGVYSKNIPAGTWQFNLTLTCSSATGTGHIEIWVYKCTTVGGSVSNLFSIDATATNVLATTVATKYTFTYVASSSYDLTSYVLVVEYWLHVTVVGTNAAGNIKLTSVSAASSVKVPNFAPTNDACGVLDLDSGSVLAWRKYYSFSVNVTDASGVTDLNYVELRFEYPADTYTTTSCQVRWTESTNTFAIVGTADLYISISGSTKGSSGNQVQLVFKVVFDWDYPLTTDIDAQVYSLDDSSASDTDTYNLNMGFINTVITTPSSNDYRQNIGGTVTISGTITYTGTAIALPNTQISTNGVVVHNSAHASQGTSSVASYSISITLPSSVGSDTYHIYVDFSDADISDGDRGSSTSAIITDRLQIQSYTLSDSRANINDNVNIDILVWFDFDNTVCTTATITINGFSATHQGSGVYRITQTSATVTSVTYNIVACSAESTYGITTVDQNSQATTVIWDRIKINTGSLTVADSRIDIGTLGQYWCTAQSEYTDAHVLGSGDSLVLSGYTFTWCTTHNRWEYNSTQGSVTTITINSLTSVNEATYGITVGNINSNTAFITWDRLEFVSVSADDTHINVGGTFELRYQIRYDFDDVTFNSSKGSITGFVWDSVNSWWNKTVTGSSSVTSTNYDETYISITDSTYGLTVKQDVAGADVVTDRIRIDTLNVVNNYIPINTEGEWYATASLEFDGHVLGSGDSFTLSGYAFTWDAVHSRFEHKRTEVVPITITIDSWTSGTETTYSITAGNINSKTQAIEWYSVGFNLNLRVKDWDLTDNIVNAYVYMNNGTEHIKISDVNGWANWTLVSGVVTVQVKYFGFWVNGTTINVDSDKTINLKCNLYDVTINVRENIRNAKLSNVNITVYNGTNYKIKSEISNNNGQVILTNLPNNTLTFTCYAKSDYSLVIKNVARNITQDEQIETIICDENYVGTTSNYSILVWVGGIVIPLEGSFVTKRLKRKMYKKRKKPK
jgi:hypothetical protein